MSRTMHTKVIRAEGVSAYSHCPRKAFLLHCTEDRGTPNAYAGILEERASANRASYLANLQRTKHIDLLIQRQGVLLQHRGSHGSQPRSRECYGVLRCTEDRWSARGPRRVRANDRGGDLSFGKRADAQFVRCRICARTASEQASRHGMPHNAWRRVPPSEPSAHVQDRQFHPGAHKGLGWRPTSGTAASCPQQALPVLPIQKRL